MAAAATIVKGLALTGPGTIDPAGALAGGVQTTTVTLTQTQIQGMFATPVTLVAAVSGAALLPVGSITVIVSNPGGAATPFAGGGTVQLGYPGYPNTCGGFISSLFRTTALSSLLGAPLGSDTGGADIRGLPITISNASAAYTDGDVNFTATIILSYYVVKASPATVAPSINLALAAPNEATGALSTVGRLRTGTFVLSRAQVQSMFTTPIVLVPGVANRIVAAANLLAVDVKHPDLPIVPFVPAGACAIGYTGNLTIIVSAILSVISTPTAEAFRQFAVYNNTATGDVRGLPVVMSTITGPITGGGVNSTVTITMAYYEYDT